MGNVINHTPDPRGEAKSSRDEWNEISIVHYPTIKHFCDMLAMEDYQAINEKHRLGVSSEEVWLALRWSVQLTHIFRR